MAKSIGTKLIVLAFLLGTLSSCVHPTVNRISRHERLITANNLFGSSIRHMYDGYRRMAVQLDCESFALVEIVYESHAEGLCVGYAD